MQEKGLGGVTRQSAWVERTRSMFSYLVTSLLVGQGTLLRASGGRVECGRVCLHVCGGIWPPYRDAEGSQS